MRSLIIATVLLAAVAQGFVDFTGMSGAPKKTIHPVTGNIHYEHDVHHIFPHPDVSQPPTYFKASYTAEHEARWNIIELHEHIENLSGSVGCGMGDDGEIDHLAIANPSAALLQQVHSQKTTGYSHTVITAAAHHQCHGKGIFRRLQSVTENEDGSIFLNCKAISYNHIFKNLDLHINTNHVHQSSAPMETPEQLQVRALASEELQKRLKPQKMSMNRHFLQRPMSTQRHHHHSFFHHITHAVSHAVHHVVHEASHVAHDAEHDIAHAAKAVGHVAKVVGKDVVKVAKKVYSAVSSFSIDHTFSLPGLNWNKDVTKSFSQWDMTVTETIHLAASFSFHPSVTFNLKVEEFHLQNLEAYFEGVATAGVTGSFSLDIQKVIGGSKVITTIKIKEITFSIGPVPVWLKPSVPIYAGFDVAFDADFTVSAVISASSTVKFGYAYSPATGHRHISEHDFTFKHDFGPMDYTIDIGVGAYVMPVLSVTIESVGEVQVGARIQANAVLESNNDCLIALDINAVPTISLNAAVNLHLLHHDIFQHQFGPYTLWTTKWPLYNYCKPQKASVKKFLAGDQGSWNSAGQLDRSMVQQSSNGNFVTKTNEKKLTPRHIGQSWQGKSVSIQPNGMTMDMVYGAQFTVEESTNSSMIYFTLALSAKSPNQPRHYQGKLAATATLVYVAPKLPEVGQIMNYTLRDVVNSTYLAASNSSVLAVIPSPFMLWKTSAEDIRFVEIEADMVYGTVSMVSPSADNNTASFTIFKEGGASLDVAGLELSKSDILGIMIYAVAATVALMVSIVAALCCYRRFNKARRSVEMIVAKEEGSSSLILSGDGQTADDELNVNA